MIIITNGCAIKIYLEEKEIQAKIKTINSNFFNNLKRISQNDK